MGVALDLGPVVERNATSPVMAKSNIGAPNLFAGVLAGTLAGLAAAWVMNAVQSVVLVTPPGNADSATAKTANLVHKSVTGKLLAKTRKKAVGNYLHFAFGAFLGSIYGALAEYCPVATTGFGMPFGLTVAGIADEVLVPLLGLSVPPWKSSAKSHTYGLVSHIVFGSIVEATRRTIRSRL